MPRIFMTATGLFYKADAAANPADAEKPIGTQEFLDTLTETPQKMEDLQAKMEAARLQPRVSGDISFAVEIDKLTPIT